MSKSGAQKRKEKLQTEIKVSAKACKLFTSFFLVQPLFQGNIESNLQITSEILKARGGKDLDSSLKSTSAVIQALG